MKILLVGEYSRLHNSLKEGLIELGHEVIILGNQDGFKKFPIDIKVNSFFSKNAFLKKTVSLVHKLFRINLISLENAIQWYYSINKMKNFDIVQLYNESIAKTYPSLEIKIINQIIKSNKKVFLLSCGVDFTSVKFAHDKKFRYSILTPLHENEQLKDYYKFILNKLKPQNYKLHNFIFNNIKGVIASDIDYHIPLLNNSNYLGLIPNPINTNKIDFIPLDLGDKIIIFHGINRSGFIKKGNIFFELALERIQKKYKDRIEVIVTEDLPYNEYIQHYRNCHILLDQVYAYDQGYNALEAMAMGKVVFTGAEKEWLDYYNLKEDTIAINALPNEVYIEKKLEWLILNPHEIIKISKQARQFIEKEHNYIESAKKYLDAWSKAN